MRIVAVHARNGSAFTQWQCMRAVTVFALNGSACTQWQCMHTVAVNAHNDSACAQWQCMRTVEVHAVTRACRHQEDGDDWEAMGLWGRNYLDLTSEGGYFGRGSVLSSMATVVRCTLSSVPGLYFEFLIAFAAARYMFYSDEYV